MTSAPTDPLLDRLVDGRYEVVSRIARGGMATVYVANDLRLDRRVAIKIMHGHLADDEAFRERFVQEARSAARLAHPNVVSVFDQGQDDEMAFMVMEYLPGMTLRDLLKDYGRLTTEQTLDIMEAVLGGLAAAHKAGIVHRDVKPENVLLADDGRIKIGDFGLARAASANTATGQALLGTIAYLSPELLTRGVADARSDLYASGIMMYEMLVGEQPYLGEQPMQIAFQHANEIVPAPSVRIPGVPHEVDELVRWATAKSPDDRPHDARDLLEALLRAEASVSESLRRAAPGGSPQMDVFETRVMPAGLVAGGAGFGAGMGTGGGADAGAGAEAGGFAPGGFGAGGSAQGADHSDVTSRFDMHRGDDDASTGETQVLRQQKPKGGRRAAARAAKAAARSGAGALGAAGGGGGAAGVGAGAGGADAFGAGARSAGAGVASGTVAGGLGAAGAAAASPAGAGTAARPAGGYGVDVARGGGSGPATHAGAGHYRGQASSGDGRTAVVRPGERSFAAGFGAPGTQGGSAAAAVAEVPPAASTRHQGKTAHRPGGAVEKLRTKAAARRRRGWWIAALVVTLLVAGGGTGWYFSSGPGGQVSIPSLAGQTPGDASAALQALGLQLGEQESATSPTVPAGTVVGTDPGGSVLNGSTVSLVVSAGPAQLPVPTLVGQSEDAANAAVSGLFTVTDAQRQFVPDVAAGIVMQALGADGQPLGATYGEQQPVTFVVSLGAVPDVVGASPDDAASTLSAVNLQTATGSSDYSETIPEGDVISVGLPAAPVVPGSTITLNTSKGPAPIAVPDVAGASWADAKSQLQNAGFTLAYSAVADLAPAAFVVSGTDPSAGTLLPRGTKVAVSFSGF